MEFRLLGPIEVIDEGRRLYLGPRKQRALLCLLLLHANRVVTTDRILDDLWGDDAPGKENALWVVISRLRSALEPDRDGHGESTVLLTRDHGYVLQVNAEDFDVTQFETGVDETRRLLQHDPASAAECVDGVLALWRGTPAEEFQHEEFARLDVDRLDELRLEGLELRAEAGLQLGRAREQVADLEVLHSRHPYREHLVRLLMRSLYQAGQQADALRVFDRYRRTIGEELGIEPSPELRRLEEQILLHDPTVRSEPRERVHGEPVVADNPFKGLRSFGEHDADDFFGRDRLVSDVIRRLDSGQRLIALVGASGSGKSSAVRAGVVPAIRKGAVEGSDGWLVAQMVPGSRPIVELEAALLRSSLDAPDSLTDQLADPDAGLLRAALRILPHDGRLVVVIDQFEELFTLVDDEAERAGFLDLLAPALDEPHGRVIVVLTLRADFYDRPLMYPEFARRLGDGVVNVSTLTPDELESSVQEPMRRSGVAVEPTLLAALLTDVIGQPGALPLFQYTLTMLFDRREAGVVTLGAYRAMGGLKGALAQRAEDLWSELTEPEGAAARQLFLRLVTITGDREWSRRRVAATELTALRRDLIATQRVIESFGEQRLLAFDRDQLTGSPTVEVAHEALLTEWPRLRAWIDEAHDDVVRHAALVVAMNEWHNADRNPDYLLVGQRLVDYESWSDQTVFDLTDVEHDFLRRSTQLRDDADRHETNRVRREAALASRVRQRTIGLIVALVLVVGGALTVWLATRTARPARIAYIQAPFESNVIAQERAGWEQAQREHGFEAIALQPITDAVDEVSRLISSGVELVVVSIDATNDLEAIARANPETSFVVNLGFEFDVGLSNVTSVYFESDAEAGYLAGATAAEISQTGVVGFIGALPGFNEPFRSGFEAGALATDPTVEVLSTYMRQDGTFSVFDRPDEGAVAAQLLYERGADIVFHAAGNSGDRVPMVADELSETLERHLWVIGVDVDQWLVVNAEQQQHVLTSIRKRHDLWIPFAVDRYFEGDLDPGPLAIGLADDAVGFSTSGGHLTADAIEHLESLLAAMAAGVISAPATPFEPPTILAAADIGLAASVADGQCNVTAPPIVDFGNTIRVEFNNNGESVAGVGIFDESPSGVMSPDAVPVLLLNALPRGGNAAVIDLAWEGTWTVACVDQFFTQIGDGTRFEVRDPKG